MGVRGRPGEAVECVHVHDLQQLVFGGLQEAGSQGGSQADSCFLPQQPELWPLPHRFWEWSPGPCPWRRPGLGKAVGSGMGWTVEVLEGPRPYAQRRVRNPEVSPGAQMCAAAARAFWGCQPPAGMAPTHRPARLRASPGQPGQVASSICQVESSVPSGASAPELSP